MERKIELRPIGQRSLTSDKAALVERFSFPSALTSVLEGLDEDPGLAKSGDTGSDEAARSMYKRILASSGMAFGLLWSPDFCTSSLDLMQVADHDETIRRAFNYVAYDFEIIEKSSVTDNKSLMWDKVLRSINEGKGVLAFGIIGPPECSLVTGYNEDGQILYGWSHFQSHAAEDCDTEGRFVSRDWYENIWKIVIVGEKKSHTDEFETILKQGSKIARSTLLDGYFAGPAAYDAWINFVKHLNLSNSSINEQRTYLDFLKQLVLMQAEAKEALATFIRYQGNEDSELLQIAKLYEEISELARKIYALLPAFGDQSAYLRFEDPELKKVLCDLIRSIDHNDSLAAERLMLWLSKKSRH